MKEEKAVRDWKNAAGVDDKLFMREVSALIRAIRADEREKCAKVAYNEACCHNSGNSTWDRNVAENIAAAIRSAKQGGR